MASTAPPPPPHGTNPSTSPLPPGNYDIFVIPPSSAGSGFLYLPSLRPNPNSFVAGFACAAALIALWIFLLPIIRHAIDTFTSGGGHFLLIIAAAGAAFVYGRQQSLPSESRDGGDASSSNSHPAPDNGPANPTASNDGPNHAYNNYSAAPPPPPPPPRSQPAPPQQNQSRQDTPSQSASSTWEQAREETRRKEQDRQAAAEKLRWEQARAREKEAREREARERTARKAPTNFSDPNPGVRPKSNTNYEQPTAQSYHGTTADTDPTSFRPYDTPPPRSSRRHPHQSSTASSVSGHSESSWAASAYTSASSAPPSHASNSKRGPYTTTDPEKVLLGGVHLFTSSSGPHPASQLLSRQGEVTDGLILRITTEGLFIDDDVRHVPQREWDIKAWSIKLVETGKLKQNNATAGLNVLRVTIRGDESRRYVFVVPAEHAWKVDLGLEKLRKGPQVRAMGMSGIKEGEVRGLLTNLGWLS